MSRPLRFGLLCLILAWGQNAPSGHAADVTAGRVFRVQEFDAVGDGTTLNTAAIQKAIDTCSAAGGGCVVFSPGVYLSGTLFLKDHVRLVLEANAVLRGSARPEDYPPITRKKPDAPPFTLPPFAGGGFLIYAEGVHDVSIEGRGTIDGQGSEFWFPEMLTEFVRKPKPNRPLSLVALVSCQSLLVRDVTLTNSPCYTLWLLGCTNVNVDGITIRNPHEGPNTDGIDVDCCRDVRIANCSIDGGDDAIAVRSDAGQLGEDMPCENVTVTNCTLCSVPACAVRVGYAGDSVLRNCTFSNLTIYDSDIGLDMISILPNFPWIRQGTRCENVLFNNIVMRNVKRAIFFWMGNETGGPTQLYMKDIQVSNVVAQTRFGSYIGGYDQRHCENVSLTNLRLICSGQMSPGAPPDGADVWGGAIPPYALYCRWIDGLRIKDLQIDLRAAQGSWRYGVFCENVRDARLSDLQTQGFARLSGQAALGLKNATAAIRDCDAEPEVSTFLQAVEGSQVFVSGCDLSRAKSPLTSDPSSTIRGAGSNGLE